MSIISNRQRVKRNKEKGWTQEGRKIMAKRRKYTKKWLKKPDEFITIFDQAISFISRYQKSLIWGMAGVVLVGSAIGVLLYFQKITERELEGSIVEAHFLYLQAETSNKGDFTEALQAYQAVVQKFPRQKKSITAYLYLGHIYSQIGDNRNAARMYQRVTEVSLKETMIREIALMGLGHSHEAMTQYSQAITNYKKITEHEKALLKGQALLALGRCYEQLKDYKSALIYYSRYLSDLSDRSTPASEVIQEKVERLKALRRIPSKEGGVVGQVNGD